MRLPQPLLASQHGTCLQPGYGVQRLGQGQSHHSPLVNSGVLLGSWKEVVLGRLYSRSKKTSALVSLMHDVVDAALRKGGSLSSGCTRVIVGSNPDHQVMCHLSVALLSAEM